MTLRVSSSYRPEIDGLRAIAVLSVIFYHAGFGSFRGGYVGVDVFFVISGYLITRIIHEELSGGVFTLSNFYVRRIRRIIPALLVVLAACIPFAYSWMPPDKLKDFSASAVATILFVSNIFFWKQADYFSPDIQLRPLIHMWSLSIEEQFYVLYPIALVFLYRYARRLVVPAILLFAIVSFACAEFLARSSPAANFYLLPSRAWELLAGALLAMSYRGQMRLTLVKQAGSMAGIALIAFAVVTYDHMVPYPSRWTLIPVLGTLLILGCSGAGDLAGKFLSSRAMVSLGLVSYSAYLWHQPVFAFARLHSLNAPSQLTYLVLAGCTFLLAFVTYGLVEAPCRRVKLVAARDLLQYLAAAAAFVLVAGIAGYSTDGLAQLRAQPPTIVSTEAHSVAGPTHLTNLDKCYVKQARGPECRTSESPEILVWGDSFAGQLTRGILESKPGVGLIEHGMGACGPILGVSIIDRDHPEQYAKDCVEFNSDAIRIIRELGSVRYAVLSMAIKNYITENRKLYVDGEVVESSPDLVVQRIVKTVETLQALNIGVRFISPAPEDGRNVGDCLAKSIKLLGHMTDECDINHAKMMATQAGDLAVLQKLERAGVSVVFLKDILCDGSRCQVREGDNIFYHDDVHLSHEGSSYLGKKFNFYKLFVADIAPSQVNISLPK